MRNTFLLGIVLDLVVIPWPYVFRTFVRAPGARWKATRTDRTPASPSGWVRGGDSSTRGRRA